VRKPYTLLVVLFLLLVNPAKSLATPPPQTFLIASDLHFNPFADPPWSPPYPLRPPANGREFSTNRS
jgi:hypothetical protein